MKAKLLTMMLIICAAFVAMLFGIGVGAVAMLLYNVVEALGWAFVIVAAILFSWLVVSVIFGIKLSNNGENKEGGK